MKYLILIASIFFVFLQYKIWFSDSGVRHYWALKKMIQSQTEENEKLSNQNKKLTLEIKNLKEKTEGIETHAREDLNMIKSDEVFFQWVNPYAAHKKQ